MNYAENDYYKNFVRYYVRYPLRLYGISGLEEVSHESWIVVFDTDFFRKIKGCSIGLKYA